MVAEGYGIGGYGGLDEPWGSVEYPLGALSRTSARTDYVGIIEALSSVIGELDNEIGGLWSTRLTTVAAEGDVFINVESTKDWSGTSGKVGIDGITYYYAYTTETTINELTYVNNGVSTSGIAKLHRVDSEVVNLNRELSALDLTRRALLVDYAEGPYLDVIGRRLGVPRKPLYGDDDQYRAIIKAIAYSPRGTTYGIELALDSLLGVGTYEIYEDLVQNPCEVFIKVGDAVLLEDNPYGKTYLSENLFGVTSGTYETIVLGETPLQVSWVKLKSLGEVFDFRNDIPSDVEYVYYPGDTPASAFTYAGGLSETNVTENGLYTTFNAPSAGTIYYSMLDTQGARVTTDSVVTFEASLLIPTASVLGSGLLEQISFSVSDGNRRISVGVEDDYSIGLFDTEGGGFLGNTYTLSVDTFYDVTVIKNSDVTVSLYVNNTLVTTVDYSDFTTAVSSHVISFGLQGTPSSGAEFSIKQLSIDIQNSTDLWSSSYETLGFVNVLTPNRYDITGTHSFVSGDVGKCFEVKNATTVNAYGGNNNGRGTINSVISGTVITLSPKTYIQGTINNNLFILPDHAPKFVYPDDLGKKIEIIGSSLGNDGTYVITNLYVENSLQTDGIWLDFADYSTSNIDRTTVAALSSSLVNEVDLEFTILIDFITESNLGFTHSHSGTQSTNTLTLKTALWKNGLLMEVGISNVLTGQLLIDTDIHNTLLSTDPLTFSHYPFYLSDTVGALKGFIDDLTIAGVIPRIVGI